MMTNAGMFLEPKLKDKIKVLKDRVKDLVTINNEHQIMNGNMHKEIENLKKNETLLKEDLQSKDLEIGKMMKKLEN